MKRVLIVDDDHAILEAMQLAIEDEGYEVEIVADGNDAVAKAKKFSPDIILLDLLLSGKDGTEIIAMLKKEHTTKGIPVILLSAHPTAAKTAEECGATSFLAKPFDVDELLNVVRKYVE